MILKVNPDELNNVSNNIKKDVDVFNTEIEKINGNIEKLKLIWQGEDADRFNENFTGFVNKMKSVPNTLDVLSKTCDNTNRGYQEIDLEISSELKGEAVE